MLVFMLVILNISVMDFLILRIHWSPH